MGSYLRLGGSILAVLAGLASPARPLLRGGGSRLGTRPDSRGQPSVDPSGRPVGDGGEGVGIEGEDGGRPSHGLPIVPVSPVPRDDASADRHRPHPSYLDGPALLTPPSPRSHGDGRRKLSHATAGTFKNLVLLLRFSDHGNRTLPTQSDISRLYNHEHQNAVDLGPTNHRAWNIDDEITPTGSVRNYFLENSRGALVLETTVVDWIDLPNTEAHYAGGKHGFGSFKQAIRDALDILDADATDIGTNDTGVGFNFSAFDLDENGALDGFGVLHSGYAAEYAGPDCYQTGDLDRIWSHKGGLDWSSSSQAGVEVTRYYASSALREKCGSGVVRMGVICHEVGHYLGLPDLYDPSFDGTGLGAYDVMSQSWGWDGSGVRPPNLSAWSKAKVGWVEVRTLEEDGTYVLEVEEVATSNETVFKITKGFPEGEYLLLENRQPRGYDEDIMQGGIAVHHVDEMARGHFWPHNGEHYRIALLGADGSYDLERGVNHGDAGDLWHAGSLVRELMPFGEGRHPNTDAYQDGIVLATGIWIFAFSESDDAMTFRVEGLGQAQECGSQHRNPRGATTAPTSAPTPATSAPTSAPTLAPTPSPALSDPFCVDLCLAPLADAAYCPSDPWNLPDCVVAGPGDPCEVDGECGTDATLNNCGAYDVYRRVECDVTNDDRLFA
ncbi:hypothetical protein ACHAWF_018592 [Thalassiosira exigua]